jgi:hypothetical protein
MVYSLIQKNTTDTFQVQNNLVLETTRLFLTKHNDFSKIHFRDSNLYFENNLLLEQISQYEISRINDINTINICVYENKICQVWKIKL